jgi:putative ABC transport system permease protein
VKGISVLDRKLIRDLWHLRGQMAAVAVVVACGVAVVMTTRTSYNSLLGSRTAYYREYRFADLFVSVKRAPEDVATRLAAVPGVATVDTRVVVPVTLDVPGLAEPATGRLVSVPERGQPALNGLHLRRGRWIEPGRRDEVIASEAFAEANRLSPGSTLGGVINGRWQRLRIVGIAISPEYVYEIAGGSLFPDNRRFGVLWMSRDALAGAFDMVGAFNDAAFQLASGAREREVKARVDALLARYGGLGTYGRSEQVSARFLNDEIGQNRVSGTIIPAIFLGIAAFLLNIVLARLVGTQREQIGTLRAFGYSSGAIGAHYLKFAVAALLIGALVGMGAGAWLASLTNAQYSQFYRFPAFLYRLDWSAVGIAFGITSLAAVLGAAGAIRRVIGLPAAVAMQPEPPARFRPGILERLGLAARIGIQGRMILRGLSRRPLKAALSALGIAFAASILLVGRFFVDAIGYLGDVHFRRVQREDVAVTFAAPRGGAVRYEAERLPGVRLAEAYRAVPVRLRAGHRSRRVAVLGLPREGELHRLLDRKLDPVTLPSEGLLLTGKLAEILRVAASDTVTLEVLEGRRDTVRTAVAGTVDELLGLSAYMDRNALDRLIGEGRSMSGALLRVDPESAAVLNTRLKRLPQVAGVASRLVALANFQATLARSIGLVTGILIGFAGSLAVAMIYNTARIALSERARELASLRVLGFSQGEVTTLLLGEQGILAAGGTLAGLAMGYGFCAVLSNLYEWELFRIPLVVSRGTFAFAVLVVGGSAVGSTLLVWRRVRQLDLIGVLKSRE